MSPKAPNPLTKALRSTVAELGLMEDGSLELFDRTVRMTQRLSGMPSCMFAIVGGSRPAYRAAEGVAAAQLDAVARFCADAVLQHHCRTVPDLRRHPALKDHACVTGRGGLRSLAGVPIHAPNRLPVGALCVLSAKANATKQPMLTAALDDACRILEDALVLQSQVIRDPQTSLYNRVHFDESLAREWARSFRHLTALPVLLVEINGFRRFSGAVGRERSDEILELVADVVRSAARRAGDVAARYGSSEFALLLPETPPAVLRRVAKDIHQGVARLKIPHRGSKAKLTVSIGGVIVSGPEHLTFGDRYIMMKADDALVKAKRPSGTRTVIHLLASKAKARSAKNKRAR